MHTFYPFYRLCMLFIIALGVFFASSSIAPAQAAGDVSTVSNTNDSGAGSLRAVLNSATKDSVIRFAPALANKTITLTSGQLNITKSLTIDGADAPKLTISGNNTSRVFFIANRLSVTLKNLTIANGKAVSMGDDKATGAGGGVRLDIFGKLTVENCTFRNNIADWGGGLMGRFRTEMTVTNSVFENNDGTPAKFGFSAGGIVSDTGGTLVVRNSQFSGNNGIVGGAIYKLLGALTVENSTFRNNVGRANGGAIYTDGANIDGPNNKPTTVGGTIAIRNNLFEKNQGFGEGGALFLYVYEKDTVLLENNLLIENTVSPNSNGTAAGGGLRGCSNGRLIIRNTTFANNKAKQGGGLWVAESLAPVTIENSTFSGNLATGGDNLSQGAAMAFINNIQPVNITHATIVSNTADYSNGAFFWNRKPAITIINSIIANNIGAIFPGRQTVGTLQDGGGNIEWPAPSSGGKHVTDGSQVVDPRVLPLENLDGVWVHPLPADSPAVDTGVQTGSLATDQRGLPRDAKPDVGAFELLQRLIVTPNLVFAGSDALTVRVDGANFTPQSVIRFDGANRPTTVVNSTRLTTRLSAADLESPRTITVSVSNSSLPGQPFAILRRNGQVHIPIVARP